MINAKITCIEYYLPGRVLLNEDLARENPDWDIKAIESKTGIRSRHIANESEHASDLAVKAAEKLFDKNNVDRNSIDTLLFCTQSPDYVLPTTACSIQERLKLPTNTASFDYNLGCSGYIYGLAAGGAMIHSGISRKVLLLCAETYSKYIPPNNRVCRPVFGDAGAATLIEPSGKTGTLGPFVFGTDGTGKDKLIVRQEKNTPVADSNSGIHLKQSLYMDGPAIFLFTMNRVPECTRELLAKAEKTINDVDLYIFHQANKLVVDNIVDSLSLPESKVFRGYEKVGNTVSASIPLALKQAQEERRLKQDDLVMLVGFGVGYSWGACLVRWEMTS